MKYSKLHLGYSTLTDRIYFVMKNDNQIGKKRDITSEFIQVMLHKFEPNTIQNLTIDGEDKYRVLVVDVGKKITVDGDEV